MGVIWAENIHTSHGMVYFWSKYMAREMYEMWPWSMWDPVDEHVCGEEKRDERDDGRDIMVDGCSAFLFLFVELIDIERWARRWSEWNGMNGRSGRSERSGTNGSALKEVFNLLIWILISIRILIPYKWGRDSYDSWWSLVLTRITRIEYARRMLFWKNK